MLRMISGFFMGIWTWIVKVLTSLWVLTYNTLASLPWKEIGMGAITLLIGYFLFEFLFGDDGII